MTTTTDDRLALLELVDPNGSDGIDVRFRRFCVRDLERRSTKCFDNQLRVVVGEKGEVVRKDSAQFRAAMVE